jgi:hypothetical protein
MWSVPDEGYSRNLSCGAYLMEGYSRNWSCGTYLKVIPKTGHVEHT